MSDSNYPFIDSVKDEELKNFAFFGKRKNRNAKNIILLDGEQELLWALEYGAKILSVLVTEDTRLSPITIESERAGAKISVVKKSIFERQFQSYNSDAFAALAKLSTVDLQKLDRLSLFLENIIDPGNIGTMIRTARSFGIKNFFSNNQDSDWLSKKSLKASRGSHFLSNFKLYTDSQEAISDLKKSGLQIIGTSPHAKQALSISKLMAKPSVLLLGNEQNGLSKEAQDQCDVLVSIPMLSDLESLNVAVAAGISIYELYYRLVLSMLTNNIQENLGRNIGVLFQLFPQVLNQELAQYSKLSANQVIFLMILKVDGLMARNHAEKDLERLGEKKSSIDFLAKENLLKISPDQKIQISSEGESTLAKLWMIIENSENKILSVLSEQERLELKSMLTRLEHKCEELLSKKPDKQS